MPLYDFSEFLKLSSALNYNLSAASLNRYNVLMFIIDGKHFHSNDNKDRESKRILMETLSYLFNAYSQKRRRLGPLAVLHPLRTAALFARNFNTLNLIDLLSALLHDILEDIKRHGRSASSRMVKRLYQQVLHTQPDNSTALRRYNRLLRK